MKKVFVLVTAMMAVVMSAKAEVNFAYDAGAEVVSAYIWRGQYNGGLSFQPDVEIGYDGEHTSLRIGAWGNLGASDWKFKKDQGDGAGFTKFMPELDIVGKFSFFGASVGFNHYYYCDGSNFFSWQKAQDVYDSGNTSTTEVWVGYNFEHFFGVNAYINWYTTVAGNDLRVSTIYPEMAPVIYDANRAWSSYLELGYDYTWDNIGLTLGGQIGMSPWASDMYGNDGFAVTNLTVKLNKEWEFDACTLDLFAQGTLNPDGINKNNVYINEAGDDKLYMQKLNGVIGVGVWF